MFLAASRRTASSRSARELSGWNSIRAVGSVPRLQAQVVEVIKDFRHEEGSIPPFIANHRQAPKATLAIIRPVMNAMPTHHDEFWRKLPVWENVSTQDFLSYRWIVSTAAMVLNQTMTRWLSGKLMLWNW